MTSQSGQSVRTEEEEVQWRDYLNACELFENGQYGLCTATCQRNLENPHITPFHRMRNLMQMAAATRDWYRAQRLLAKVEFAWLQRQAWVTTDIERREQELVRSDLDQMKEWQLEDRPKKSGQSASGAVAGSGLEGDEDDFDFDFGEEEEFDDLEYAVQEELEGVRDFEEEENDFEHKVDHIDETQQSRSGEGDPMEGEEYDEFEGERDPLEEDVRGEDQGSSGQVEPGDQSDEEDEEMAEPADDETGGYGPVYTWRRGLSYRWAPPRPRPTPN